MKLGNGLSAVRTPQGRDAAAEPSYGALIANSHFGPMRWPKRRSAKRCLPAPKSQSALLLLLAGYFTAGVQDLLFEGLLASPHNPAGFPLHIWSTEMDSRFRVSIHLRQADLLRPWRAEWLIVRRRICTRPTTTDLRYRSWFELAFRACVPPRMTSSTPMDGSPN